MIEDTQNQDPFGFASLEGDLNEGASAAKPPPKRERHACEHCAGSGKWSGGMNRHGNSKCNACGGRGYFLTDAKTRMANRQKARQSKASRLDAAQAAFNEAEPGLIEDLQKLTEWNSFAQSLVGQFSTKGDLSPGQIAAARKMLAKVEKTTAGRDAKRESEAVEVDLSPIQKMFATAMESGLKRPTYRAEGLIISRAPDHGRNAGALYIKRDGEYQGKITDSRFYAVRSADECTADAIKTIAADPEAAAVRYGRLAGSCSCCGRELTNPVSIERGIGPICADKYGL